LLGPLEQRVGDPALPEGAHGDIPDANPSSRSLALCRACLASGLGGKRSWPSRTRDTLRFLPLAGSWTGARQRPDGSFVTLMTSPDLLPTRWRSRATSGACAGPRSPMASLRPP